MLLLLPGPCLGLVAQLSAHGCAAHRQVGAGCSWVGIGCLPARGMLCTEGSTSAVL